MLAKKKSYSAQIISLLKKEWTFEIRHRSAFYSVFLYSLLTVFLIFYSFKEIEPVTWVNLFWIITLFASLNAMAKSFLQESQQRWNYYYTLHSAEKLIVAKFIYNFILLMSIAIFNLILFSTFLGFSIADKNMFLCSLFLGVLAFVLMFTIMSAISAKASKNGSLTAILSLPVLIPLLSVLSNFSLKTISHQSFNLYQSNILLLSAMNVLMLGLGVLLFQMVWRE